MAGPRSLPPPPREISRPPPGSRPACVDAAGAGRPTFNPAALNGLFPGDRRHSSGQMRTTFPLLRPNSPDCGRQSAVDSQRDPGRQSVGGLPQLTAGWGRRAEHDRDNGRRQWRRARQAGSADRASSAGEQASSGSRIGVGANYTRYIPGRKNCFAMTNRLLLASNVDYCITTGHSFQKRFFCRGKGLG